MASFEKLMTEGAKILEHYPNQKDPTGRRFHTVKVTLTNSEIRIFPNLRVEHLRPFVNPADLDELVEDGQKHGGSTEGEDEEGKRSRSSLEPAGEEKTKEHAHDAKTPEPPKKKQKQHTNRDHERVKVPAAHHSDHSEKKEKEGKSGSNEHGKEKEAGSHGKEKEGKTGSHGHGKEKDAKTGSHGHGAGRNFEKMMEERPKIIDYHQTQSGNYTVHVSSPDGTIDVFSNISPEHFARYRTEEAVERQPGQPEQPASRPHLVGDTFEKVMESGGRITNTTAFVSHSVRIIMPPQDGEEKEWIEFFGNGE
ncbi:hypothetical protein BC937DRAFT_90601 [Endogone sp. FLAS-F59071]|nr:hypothetical protein BC937DRAFT_90601 [Endogone sp. FLAS-F59071]|eukprot:RUS16966.1 hypothetical protein BC937DRAFT_90601 [Endogone sp. FLAS-F59071]